VEINPYQSPQSIQDAPAVEPPTAPNSPTYRLYSPGSVTLAGFLGGTIAASVVMAINFARLSRHPAIWQALAIGLATQASLIAIAMVLPADVPASLFTGVTTLLSWGAAKAWIADDYAAHLDRGGRKASAWGAAGIALLCAVGLFVVMISVVFFVVVFVDPTFLDNLE
jgi:hypothetical protein